MYECNVCEIKTSTKKDLKKHMKDEHASLFTMDIEHSVNTKYKCSVCFIQFIDSISFRQHTKSKHSIAKTKILNCPKPLRWVTFEPINLEDYPLLKSLLPESYIYQLNNMKYLGYNEFRAKFEIANCSEDIFMRWLFELQTMSKVVYRVKSFNKSKNKNVIFNKVYRCVHNTFPKRYSYPRPNHTGCPATLTVRILKCSEALPVENSMAYNVVIVPSKAIVTLHHYHNHLLCDTPNVYKSPNVIQHNTHLNDHNINNNMNECSSNTSSSLQVSNENNYYNSNAEISEDTIILYEPENSETVMNDNIQNSNTSSSLQVSNENNNYNSNAELSEDIIILYVPENSEIVMNDNIQNSNTSSSLQVSNENNNYNSNAEISEDIIMLYEPENSEIVMNDNIQNSNTSSSLQVSNENNNYNSNVELSEDIIILYEPENSEIVMNDNIQNSNTSSSLQVSNENNNYNSNAEISEDIIMLYEPENSEIVMNDNIQNSNTSSSLQVSNENNNYNSNSEISEDIIMLYEPENSEIVMNDNIQNLPAENDNNIEFSDEFDSYITIEYENITNSLQSNNNNNNNSNNNDDGNELQQLLSDYDTVIEKLLQKFQSNPKCYKSAIKTYILTFKNSLTSKESLLKALKSFGNLQE